jgi:Flp pilus assembly protein TadG
MKNWIQYFRGITTPGTNPRGATAIEVKITVPPFIIAIFAVTEFDYYYLHLHFLTAATRDGIRIGALGISSSGVT